MSIYNNQHIENKDLIEVSFAKILRSSLGLSVVALGFCGFIYSSVTTGLGQVLFPEQANGSMIVENNRIVGSSLVAQPFSQKQYFHPRPSAAQYNPMAVSGSNMARTNPELETAIELRLKQVSSLEHVDQSSIPADLVTASGSGIDPDISVESAKIQVKRIAQERQISEQQILKLIQQYTLKPKFEVLGTEHVNVLKLNLALDKIGK